jgi:hypothetical protein
VSVLNPVNFDSTDHYSSGAYIVALLLQRWIIAGEDSPRLGVVCWLNNQTDTVLLRVAALTTFYCVESMPDYPPILNISTADAQLSTAYPLETAIHLSETHNMGYMASLGFFHQLHCLVSPA